jgi:tetratricopeptide (TPR) repeat protein
LALVYPSRYEGFGLPVLEAMKSGCPVITCRNSALPEVAGDAALYVDEVDAEQMANALIKVRRPEIRTELVRKGLENVKQFSWEKTGQKVVAAIGEMLGDLKDAPLNPSDPVDTVGRLVYMLNKFPGWSKLQVPLAQLDQIFLRNIPFDQKTLEDSEKAVADMGTDAFNFLLKNMDNIKAGNHFLDYVFGLALEKRGHLQKALEAYLTAVQNWRAAYPWRPAYLAAYLGYRLGHLDMARQLLTQVVLKEHPNYDEALKILRSIDDAAGVHCSSSPVTGKPEPHKSPVQSGRESVIREGDMLFKQKKCSKAKKVFEDYLKSNPGDPEVTSRLEKIVRVEENIRALKQTAKRHFT